MKMDKRKQVRMLKSIVYFVIIGLMILLGLKIFTKHKKIIHADGKRVYDVIDDRFIRFDYADHCGLLIFYDPECSSCQFLAQRMRSLQPSDFGAANISWITSSTPRSAKSFFQRESLNEISGIKSYVDSGSGLLRDFGVITFPDMWRIDGNGRPVKLTESQVDQMLRPIR